MLRFFAVCQKTQPSPISKCKAEQAAVEKQSNAKRSAFPLFDGKVIHISSYIISAAKDIQCSGTRTHLIIVIGTEASLGIRGAARRSGAGDPLVGRRRAKQTQLSLEAPSLNASKSNT